jgi:cytochrome c
MPTRLRAFPAAAALALLAAAPVPAQQSENSDDGGRRSFRACAACHTLAPGRHMTGPSLAGVLGRKAGRVQDFPRYSPAMRAADLVWDAATLDKFIADPQSVVRGTSMIFPGLEDANERAAIIGYLRAAGQSSPPAKPLLPSLKDIAPRLLVTAIRLCGDTYHVTTGDGATRLFWEFNLRFKTNSSPEGPHAGKPAILRAGMMGDRATVVFASPAEIGAFIQIRCE